MARAFDAERAPLDGPLLIDASAGTGKTRALAGLFRRLIGAGTPVERILAVTFTEAAARDLNRRIREELREKKAGDPTGKLRQAFADFDRASILTIHGFCRRVLREYNFESGASFDAELVADPTELLNAAAEDFYRLHFYECLPEFAAFALGRNIFPGTFRDIIALTLRNPGMELRSEGPEGPRDRGFSGPPSALRESARALADDFQRAAAAFRACWTAAARGDARTWLLRAPLTDGRVYGLKETVNKKTGLSNRETQTEKILEAADGFLTAGHPSPHLPERFNALRSSVIRGALKVPESRPVFDACESLAASARALAQAMEEHLIFLQMEAAGFGVRTLSERKRRENTITYDDLIAGVRAGLRSGGALKRKLREQYDAVLVDEFQDTDGAQFEIFDTLFGGGGTPLFLIGDPKQAIYTFRGGDIFTYFNAKKGIPAERHFTLGKNYRSDPRIVTSVNAIFGGRSRPFLLPELEFEKMAPHLGESALRAGGEHFPAFRIKFLRAASAGGDPGRGLAVGVARAVIAEAVACDIGRLLQSGLSAGEKALGPGDMAILVRTHREALLQKRALALLSIPAVVVGEGSVFETPEARELLRLMEALLVPGHGGKVKAALATRLSGLTSAELERINREEAGLSAWVERFKLWSASWRRGDFFPCLDRALTHFGTRERWSAGGENRRALANLAQLSESLQAVAASRGLSPRGLFKWLAERPFVTDPEAPAGKARLESDDPAVRIMTVHAAKGLQFPVVFCAFALARPVAARGPLEFHDPGAAYRRVLFFPAGSAESKKSDAHQAARSACEDEQRSEQLRLAYVGLTRAECHCSLYWANLNRPEGFPLSGLIHSKRMEDKASWSDDDLWADLQSLSKATGNACAVEEIDLNESVPAFSPGKDIPALQPPSPAGRIDRRWRVASFTGLAKAGAGEAAAEPGGEDDAAPGRGTPGGAGGAGPLSGFPGGEKTGRFLHEVLEGLDFDADEARMAQAAAAGLERFFPGEARDPGPVVEAVRRAFRHPLDAGEGPFNLSQIPPGKRISELEFYFPVPHASPESLRRVFLSAGVDLPANFKPGPGGLLFEEFMGFMHGFIDLAFEYGGKFFLLDWKTNFLGDHPGDYSPRALGEEMVRRHYNLQYLIYTAALSRHLSNRLPGFDYPRHFGGVFYLFLRGLDPRNPHCGVFFARPPAPIAQGLTGLFQNG